MVVSPLHVLPSTGQVAVWFVVSVAMVFGSYVEMRRLVVLLLPQSVFSADRTQLLFWIGLAGLLAVMLPTLNCLQRGQVEILKLYLMLVGFRIFICGRGVRSWFLAGIVFAMAGILKLTPLLPVGCLVLYDAVLSLTRRSDRLARLRALSLSAGVGLGLVVFAFLLPAAILGWNANLRHLETWFSRVVTKVVDVRTTDFGEDVRTVRNQSLDNAAYRFGNWITHQFAGGPDDSVIDRPHPSDVKLPMDDPLAGELIVFGRISGLVILLLFVVRTAVYDQRMGLAATFGLACVATLVVCPVARVRICALRAGHCVCFDLAGSAGTSPPRPGRGLRGGRPGMAALPSVARERTGRPAGPGNGGVVFRDMRDPGPMPAIRSYQAGTPTGAVGR